MSDGEAEEAFLVRLYVDPEVRRRFLADPFAEARRAALPEASVAAFARMDRDGLELSARMYAHKRHARAR